METTGVELLALNTFLQSVPTIILVLTNKFKKALPFGNFVFLIPLILGIGIMTIAYFTYNTESLLVYVITGITAGVNAIISYDAANNNKTTSSSDNTVPNELWDIV